MRQSYPVNTMHSLQRYALYFSPESDSRWWHAGNQWLGRDPSAMRSLAQPCIPGLSADTQNTLTTSARRYGFHATLKAPFRLLTTTSFSELDQVLTHYCQQQSILTVPQPTVQWMGNFLALRPGIDTPDINTFAQSCVAICDHLRAPLSPKELERRRPEQLSPRQRELLTRWGYPFTEEAFRFHMTLSDNVTDQTMADALYQAARRLFDLSEPLRIASVCVFSESSPGANFQLLKRYPLVATSPVKTRFFV